jgi:hypothetical protein
MGVNISIGTLRQVVTLSNPGPPVSDGDGGFTQTYTPLDPATWRCALEKASVRNAERHFAATITSHATYVMTGRFHPGISTQTRMVWTDRSGAVHTGNVLDVSDTEGAGVQTIALVAEVVA